MHDANREERLTYCDVLAKLSKEKGTSETMFALLLNMIVDLDMLERKLPAHDFVKTTTLAAVARHNEEVTRFESEVAGGS